MITQTSPAGKSARASRTEQVQIVMSRHIGPGGRLFGGQLMEWIDIVAAVVARRHSQQNVTTLIVDHLHFKRPAFEGCTMLLTGRITYTGRTSMEVRVDSYVESLDGTRELVNSAYLVMVALDESGRPTPVPPLIPEGEEELAEWNAAEERNRLRRMR